MAMVQGFFVQSFIPCIQQIRSLRYSIGPKYRTGALGNLSCISAACSRFERNFGVWVSVRRLTFYRYARSTYRESS